MFIFNDFTDKKKHNLYEKLWKDNDFVINTETYKTKISETEESNNSYSFTDFAAYNRDKFISVLTNIFGIVDRELFAKKFDMAVSGSGNEGHKIMTLHSSSLCALLFFYNVTDRNPLDVVLNGRKVRFTDSQFEVKNRVLDMPSNMDIKLIGKDIGTNKAVEFFLESKFAEYYLYSGKKSGGISERYRDENTYSKDFYPDDFLRNNGIHISKKDDNYFRLICKKDNYPDGFKQMISHYFGIRNYISDNAPDARIYLGEILFDKVTDDTLCHDVLTEYRALYSALSKRMNKHIKSANLKTDFEVLDKELSYGLFASSEHRVEDNILKFYNMK